MTWLFSVQNSTNCKVCSNNVYYFGRVKERMKNKILCLKDCKMLLEGETTF